MDTEIHQTGRPLYRTWYVTCSCGWQSADFKGREARGQAVDAEDKHLNAHLDDA